jgi:hypothetical protein
MGKYPLAIIFAVVFYASIILDCASAQNCSIYDYVYEYTICNQHTNTHSLVWYLNPYAACTGGDGPPPFEFNLPCNLTCQDGQYLEPGATSCSNCSAGSISRGGAIYVDSWFEWPVNLLSYNTYCLDTYSGELLNTSACAGWQLDGYYVSSGATHDSQTSVLDITVNLQTSGYLNFEFLVDAELDFDGLNLFVDGNEVFSLLSTTQGNFLGFQTSLIAGYHLISFQYSKDISFSSGIDSAIIQSLEIGGIYYAWDIVCESCEEGEYAASGDGSCTTCPLNTYATWNAGECTPCLSTQYSYPGSEFCTTRPACTSNDYQVLGSQACSGGTQALTSTWLQPQICSPGVSLPAATSQACPACDPGFYRDVTSGVCMACPSGQAGGGLGVSSCQTCLAGTAASPVLSRTRFNYWLPQESTGCYGDCGTNGWRLRNNYIDSGEAHGAAVSSYYQLDINSMTPGFLYFQHYFNCSGLCMLSFFDPYSGSATGVTFDDQGVLTDVTIPLTVGPHSLVFTFLKIGATGSPGDMAQIFNITVTNVVGGGAPECATCPAGSISSLGSPYCTNCSLGYTSDPTGTVCQACTGNTFTPNEGSECLLCGAGNVATYDHSDCISPCTFAAGDVLTVNNVTYDFTALSPNYWSNLGPYVDSDYNYYVNLCEKSNLGLCYDAYGNDIDTFVCQYDNVVDWSIGLGSYAGYYALPDRYPNTTRGVEVQFTGGALGCGPFYGTAVARTTNVALVCDPYGGSGFLNGVTDQYGNDLTEDPKCTYNFEVRSIYACPLCAEGTDYSYYYTACVNGQRSKVYYWFQNPPLCHDGTSPPATAELVACSHSTVTCPAGTFLDDTTSSGNTCRNCLPGSYSVGGEQLTNYWPPGTNPVPPLPAPFTTFCTGTGCTAWAGTGDHVESGNGDSSLVASYTLVQQGYISFNYKVYSSNAGLFQFVLDNNKISLNTIGITNYSWSTYTSAMLPAGRHQFLWVFTGGIHGSPSAGNLESVSISNVAVYGTDYHASSCLPCPGGTYAPSAAATLCLPCPLNTYSAGSSEQCQACDAYEYTLGGIGAVECLSRSLCTTNDYQQVYGPCVNDTTTISYQVFSTSLCFDWAPEPITAECGVCPPTLYFSGGACAACGPEQAYNNASSACENIPAGYLNVQHLYYFVPFWDPNAPSIDKRDLIALPSDFATGCSGSCISNGWRATGVGANSGTHGFNLVDSWISLTNTWPASGSLIFTYNVVGTFGVFTGLQLEVDGKPISIDIPYNGEPETATVPIAAGTHTITWNFHQNAGDISMAELGPIELVGVTAGVAEAVPCQAGSYNPNLGGELCLPCPAGAYSTPGSTTCASCPANTYAAAGWAQCLPCPPGSFSTNASSHCSTSCVFSSASMQFDLSPLSGVVGPVADHNGNAFWFSVCAPGQNTSVCPGTHVCSKQGNSLTTVSNGNTVGFYPITNNTGTSYFSLEFDDGASCSSGTSSTVIAFTCDTESSDSLPRFVDTDQNCTSYFTWTTQLGCPVCQDASDYQLELGACDGSQQSVTKVRTGLCNGPARIPQQSLSCSVAVAFPLAALLVPLLAFIVLLGVAVVMFIRHRRITKQYSQLLNQDRSRSQSIEMTSTPLFGAGSSAPNSPST